MSASTLGDACVALLGPGPEPVGCLGPGSARAVRWLAGRLAIAGDATAARAVVVNFVGVRMAPAARAAFVATLHAALSDTTPLVLVDHNQPRAWWRRVLGAISLLLRGFPPDRARYPAARELRDAGFVIESLRLACGERVQLVRAHRRA